VEEEVVALILEEVLLLVQQVFLVDRVGVVLTVLLVGLEEQEILLQQVLLKEIMVEMAHQDLDQHMVLEVVVEQEE
jgi:hypothetical protein